MYEDLGSGVDEQIGAEVQRVQWLDFSTLGGATLAGKRILIVDEVDDTRTTLHYALRELKKDAKKQAELKGVEDETEFGIFVVHNKQKPKKAELEGLMDMKRYYAGKHVGDEWIVRAPSSCCWRMNANHSSAIHGKVRTSRSTRGLRLLSALLCLCSLRCR